MGSTEFGNFNNFCRDSTLPVCNVLSDFHNQTGPWGGCELVGIQLNNGEILGNLGSILFAAAAIAVSGYLIFRSNKKAAAVGRREMQIFLAAYALVSLAEIFTVGEIPIGSTARIAFTAIHIGAIIATSWILLINALVGYQLLDDGTPLSIGLTAGSGLVLLIATGYIALDTGFKFTGFWSSSYDPPNRHIALYVLYQLVPLAFIAAFFVLEAVLVLKILGETRPMIYLSAAAVLFGIGQVFNYVVSPYICNGTAGKIDGALFQTLFTLLSVVAVWVFWSSITEDDWPAMSTYP